MHGNELETSVNSSSIRGIVIASLDGNILNRHCLLCYVIKHEISTNNLKFLATSKIDEKSSKNFCRHCSRSSCLFCSFKTLYLTFHAQVFRMVSSPQFSDRNFPILRPRQRLLFVYAEELLNPRQIHKLEDCPLQDVHGCLYHNSRFLFIFGGRLLQP